MLPLACAIVTVAFMSFRSGCDTLSLSTLLAGAMPSTSLSQR